VIADRTACSDVDLIRFSAVSNALLANARVVLRVSQNSRSRFLQFVFSVHFVIKRYPAAKVTEQTNKLI